MRVTNKDIEQVVDLLNKRLLEAGKKHQIRNTPQYGYNTIHKSYLHSSGVSDTGLTGFTKKEVYNVLLGMLEFADMLEPDTLL